MFFKNIILIVSLIGIVSSETSFAMYDETELQKALGEFVDSNRQLRKAVEEHGKTIDKYGKTLDEFGETVDEFSKEVAKLGETVDKLEGFGETVHKFGETVDEFGKAVAKFEENKELMAEWFRKRAQEDPELRPKLLEILVQLNSSVKKTEG